MPSKEQILKDKISAACKRYAPPGTAHESLVDHLLELLVTEIDVAEEEAALRASEAVQDDAFDEGCGEGYDVGFADGQREGYDEGYDVGFTDGGEIKGSEGYDEGYNEGYEEGRNEGYDEGYEDGEAALA